MQTLKSKFMLMGFWGFGVLGVGSIWTYGEAGVPSSGKFLYDCT